MIDLSACDLESDPDAVTAQRRPVVVPVYFASLPGTIETLEGPVDYPAGAAICTGGKGERWPVSAQRFFDLYQAMPFTEPGQDGLYRKRQLWVRAKRINQPFSVNVGYKHEPIFGRPGDWLVQHSAEKRAVVADEVFRTTYDFTTCP